MAKRVYTVEVVHSPGSGDREYVTKVTYYDPRGWDRNKVGYGYAEDEREAVAKAFEQVTAPAVRLVD